MDCGCLIVRSINNTTPNTRWFSICLHAVRAMLCAVQGWVELIDVLIRELGNQVDARDNYQFTPLHSAANGGHVSAIRALLALRHELNAQDYLGRTPLHYAAMHGRVAALEELLGQGADLAQRDLRGGYTGALRLPACLPACRLVLAVLLVLLRHHAACRFCAVACAFPSALLPAYLRHVSPPSPACSAAPSGGCGTVRLSLTAGRAGGTRGRHEQQGAHAAGTGTDEGGWMRRHRLMEMGRAGRGR